MKISWKSFRFLSKNKTQVNMQHKWDKAIEHLFLCINWTSLNYTWPRFIKNKWNRRLITLTLFFQIWWLLHPLPLFSPILSYRIIIADLRGTKLQILQQIVNYQKSMAGVKKCVSMIATLQFSARIIFFL